MLTVSKTNCRHTYCLYIVTCIYNSKVQPAVLYACNDYAISFNLEKTSVGGGCSWLARLIRPRYTLDDIPKLAYTHQKLQKNSFENNQTNYSKSQIYSCPFIIANFAYSTSRKINGTSFIRIRVRSP